MAVSPFYLLGATTLAGIQARCDSALADWARDWGCARPDFTLACVRAWDWSAPRALQWQAALRSGEQALWLGCTAEFPAALYSRLFAPDARPGPLREGVATLAWEGVREAQTALGRALMRAGAPLAGTAVEPDTSAPDGQLLRRGSGAVVLSVRVGEQSMVCLLNHAAAQITPPTPLSLPSARTPLRTAVAEVPLRLTVTLGQVDVDARSLLAMAVGDVIRLDSLVEQPVAITGPTGQVLFGGHMGTSQGAFVVELVRKSAT